MEAVEEVERKSVNWTWLNFLTPYGTPLNCTKYITHAPPTRPPDDVLVLLPSFLPPQLPEHQPRYAVYTMKLDHGDGRVSYPMCLIYSTPRDCQIELQV